MPVSFQVIAWTDGGARSMAFAPALCVDSFLSLLPCANRVLRQHSPQSCDQVSHVVARGTNWNWSNESHSTNQTPCIQWCQNRLPQNWTFFHCSDSAKKRSRGPLLKCTPEPGSRFLALLYSVALLPSCEVIHRLAKSVGNIPVSVLCPGCKNCMATNPIVNAKSIFFEFHWSVLYHVRPHVCPITYFGLLLKLVDLI